MQVYAKKLIAGYKYSYLIRIVIQSYLDILVFASITIKFTDTKESFHYSDMIFAIFILILISITAIIIIFVQILKHESMFNDDLFRIKFRSIAEGFKSVHGSNLFYLIYFFKRTVYAVSLIVIDDRILQIILIFTSSLIVIYI